LSLKGPAPTRNQGRKPNNVFEAMRVSLLGGTDMPDWIAAHRIFPEGAMGVGGYEQATLSLHN
jgi:hypothetical protein